MHSNEFFFVMDRPGTPYKQQFKTINDYSASRHMAMVPELHVGGGGGPSIWFPELAEGVWVRNEPFVVGDDMEIEPVLPPLPNLLKNGNMSAVDGSVDGWSLKGQCNSSCCRPERTADNSGAMLDTIRCDQIASSKHVSSGDRTVALSEPFPTTAGGVYHISARLRLNATNCTSAAPAFFAFYQTRSEQVESGSRPLPYVKGAPMKSHAFTSVSFTYIAPSHAATATVMTNIPPGSGGGCTWWLTDVRVLRASSALVNILRTNATDVTLTGPGAAAYEAGKDFEIVDPTAWTLTADAVDLVAAYDAGQQTRIRALPGGRLRPGMRVNVSFDFLPGIVRQVTSPHAFAEPLYYEVVARTIASAYEAFGISEVFLDHDEIWGFNRDSRSIRKGLSNADALAAEMNKLRDIAKTVNPDMTVMFWDDMLNPDHTGNRSVSVAPRLVPSSAPSS